MSRSASVIDHQTVLALATGERLAVPVQPMWIRRSVILMLVAALASSSAPTVAADLEPVDFNSEVRPILSENCFHCHGPDKSSREAGFRLDVRADAIDAAAITPGEPDESSLVERVLEQEPDWIMPPPRSHKELSDHEKEILQRWIEEGAEYATHWAYASLERPPIPQPPRPALARNPIDAFIQDRLKGIDGSPSDVADPGTLLRRLSLDLVGLPPSAKEADAFATDDSPSAYDRQVGRLLASPHHGERLAQMWLDLARYADSVGFHGDQNQNVWLYRDYVIRAFNENKPFDEFTREQLAGDLLPAPTTEQRIATCFNRLNMMTREGGAQAEEYLSIYTADRIRTVSQTWLGSTFGCAECHDHKFDPISQRDFYSLGAFFADIKQWGIYSDYSYTPNPDLAGYSNNHPFPPEIFVANETLTRRRDEARTRRRELASEISTESPEFVSWLEATRSFIEQNPNGWTTPVPSVSFYERDGIWATAPKKPVDSIELHKIDSTAAIVIDERAPQHVEVSLRPSIERVAAVRLELLPAESLGGRVAELTDRGITIRFQVEILRGDQRIAVGVRHAEADVSEPTYRGSLEATGVEKGWKLRRDSLDRPHTTIYALNEPIELQSGDRLAVSWWFNTPFDGLWSADKPRRRVGRVRLSVSPLVSNDIDSLSLPSDLGQRLSIAEAASRWYVTSGATDPELRTAVRELDAKILAARGGKAPVQVTEAVAEPMQIRLLPRGDWQDQSGEVCEPATPSFLPAPPTSDERLTRLDLADWVCSDENPLTARVFVNRLWRLFFGVGLSASADDFGAQGEAPSHPDLLDWLACEFRDSGWDVRHVVRLIVTSHTYRQSSRPRSELAERDPSNRMLSSQNARRLDAEFIRDNALAVAGLVNLEIGGPPAKPYQPEGYYAAIQFPDRVYVADDGQQQYRRGVYTHWQRTFLHPMLVNFDAPSREDCTAMRVSSNSPQQALTLLNDPTFVEAAKAWAVRLIDGATSDAERVDLAYRQALARPPSESEAAGLLDVLFKLRTDYQATPERAEALLAVGTPTPSANPVELAAWTNVARVLLNLHETITRY